MLASSDGSVGGDGFDGGGASVVGGASLAGGGWRAPVRRAPQCLQKLAAVPSCSPQLAQKPCSPRSPFMTLPSNRVYLSDKRDSRKLVMFDFSVL